MLHERGENETDLHTRWGADDVNKRRATRNKEGASTRITID